MGQFVNNEDAETYNLISTNQTLNRLKQQIGILQTTTRRQGYLTLVILLLSIMGSVLWSTPAYCQDSLPKLTPDQEQYRVLAASYVYSRSLDFADEMVSREWYLYRMVNGIKKELKARRKEGMLVAPGDMVPPEIEKPKEKKYKLPVGLETGPSAGARYLEWETPLREEYNQQYLHARIIKDKLLATATPVQLKRMFEYDVRAGLDHYSDKEYRQALLFLDEAVERYPFDDVTDVMQYRAEAFIGMKLYDEAIRDYRHVLEISTNPSVRREAIEKMVLLLGDKGLIDELRLLWDEYQQKESPKSKTYWNTAFNVASYLFVNNYLDTAKELFDSFPEDHPRYGDAKLRAADCSLRQLNLEEADQRYFMIVKKRLKGKGITYLTVGEARLKMGYIDFLRGDYDLAFVNFNQADQSDRIDEQSTMAGAWSLYQLKAYPQAIKLCKELLKNHPNSFRQYEAQCLMGFASEKMRMGSSALDSYSSIMTAMDNRQDFRELNYERREAELLMKNVREMEEQIFLYGREDLFTQYKAMRKNAVLLLERINIAESIKNNPILLVIMEEQREVMRVMQEYAAVNADNTDYWNSFTYTFDKNVYRLMDAFNGLERARDFYYAKKTLVQKEEKRIFEAEIHDSLRARVNRELIEVQDKLRNLRGQIKSARGSDDAGAITDEFGNIVRRDSLILSRRGIPDDKDVPPDSRIEAWSDFAYERYTFGGLDFDDMFVKQDQVKKIDHYIRNINKILASRRPAEVDTSSFPENLFPRVVEGDSTYAAPAFPMWDPIKSPIVGPLVNKRIDESFTKPEDTSGGAEQATDSLGTNEAGGELPDSTGVAGSLPEGEVPPETESVPSDEQTGTTSPEAEPTPIPETAPATESVPTEEAPPVNDETQAEPVQPPVEPAPAEDTGTGTVTEPEPVTEPDSEPSTGAEDVPQSEPTGSESEND